MNDEFGNLELEEHVKDASTLLAAYTMTVPIDDWATADLVKFANLIDVELQERAYSEDHIIMEETRER